MKELRKKTKKTYNIEKKNSLKIEFVKSNLIQTLCEGSYVVQ